jgi:voltage-gated potassium channel Kch
MNGESPEEIKKEWDVIHRQFALAGIAAASLLSVGAIFFHIVEHLKWIDAFYFCTVTLTTVGYGDIVPKTDVEKLFTIFYVVIGIGIIATFANLLIKNATLKRVYRRSLKYQKKKTL